MTTPTPQEAQVLLILGELRGDVKGIASTLKTYDARINDLEDTADARFGKIEVRVKALEDIKLRVGGLALGVGLASGLAAPKLPQLISILLGG